MTSNVSLILNIHDDHHVETTVPTLDIEFHILFRYQLLCPSDISDDDMIIVDDVTLPEQRSSLKIPLVFLETLSLKHALETLNLESGVVDYLTEKLAEAVDSRWRLHGVGEGFALLVELGVLKTDCLSQEETDRIYELISKEFDLKDMADEGS